MQINANAQVAQTAQALGELLQSTAKATTDQATKLMKMNVEMAVKGGKELGKGAGFDVFG